jgi:SAM-dependent methyltransferase
LNHVWWRTHLRRLEDPAPLARFGDFNEVDEYLPFLMTVLDLPPEGRVLELGCARGSYSIRLAQWGYPVVGVEQSDPLLAIAREAAEQRGVEIDFRAGAPDALVEREAFDGALLLDFGTMSDAENADALRVAAAALRPGGKLAFATCNPYYWAREARTEHRVVERMDVVRQYRFDFLSAALVSRVRLIRVDGARLQLPEARARAYTVPELQHLLESSGLSAFRVHGEDSEGRPQMEQPVDPLRSPFFHCTAQRPVVGEAGDGI